MMGVVKAKLRALREARPTLPAGLEVSAWSGFNHVPAVVVGPSGPGVWLVRLACGRTVARARHNILTVEERAAMWPSGLNK